VRRLLIAVAVLALLGGCTSESTSGSTGGSPTDDITAPSGDGERTIRVGEFNIEYGGTIVDWNQTVAAAKALDADVIGIEEAWGHTRKLAAAIGYPYADPRRQIISRLPLLHAQDDPMQTLYVEIAPGEVIAIGNVHLNSVNYGPLRTDTRSPAFIKAAEKRTRVPGIELYAKALAGVAATGVPAFVVGDLNSPSHLDWTDATVGVRPQMTYPLDWPVTETLAAAGFTDSYRAVHPDPVQDPGLTWPSGRPKVAGEWNPPPNSPQDRIDAIHVIGPATPVSSEVIGEDDIDPWPSDHRALVSTFDVTPGTPPDLVSVDERVVGQGTPATVRTHGQGTVRVLDAKGNEVASQPTGGVDAALSVDTAAMGPGLYDVTLEDESGASIGTTEFWVSKPGEEPSLTVKPRIAYGDPIDVAWHVAPGNRWDWIGIYRRGADPEVASYLLWAYTDGTIEGHVSLDDAAFGKFPLPADDYTAMLLVDDSYAAVATEDFTITPG